ncbi:BLUF domain-containing protein [Zoogloea sp.]|jgi:hypothetical protein|uniref:BLUF domain-containing protein n=1 Tax=Zoogloea sp. TaxID=49181 RepID=UPI0037D992D6
MDTLFQYAYTSCIRPEISLTRVNEIIQVSRRNNDLSGITGILVFDGWRFFQYLEGPEEAIRRLVDKLRLDPRHDNYVELLSSPFDGPRRFHKWSMGYSVSADENLLLTFTNLNAAELIENMPDLVANIDFEP